MMTVDEAVLWSRLVRENSVVSHVVGVDAVAWWIGFDHRRNDPQVAQQRVNRNVHNVVAESEAFRTLV
jgi:hypothetical protein